MTLTLFLDNISPPVRSVLLLLKYLKLNPEMKHIDLFKGEHLHTDFRKINPLHTVPALKDNDYIITDSQTILVYLAEKYGKHQPHLYPKDLKLRTTVLNRLFFNSSIFFRRDSDVMTDIFANRLTNWERHLEKIYECYGFLEQYLTENDYIAGGNLSVADFSTVATLSTLDLLVAVNGDQYPQTKKWFEMMQKMEYYSETNQQGLDRLRELLLKVTDKVRP